MSRFTKIIARTFTLSLLSIAALFVLASVTVESRSGNAGVTENKSAARVRTKRANNIAAPVPMFAIFDVDRTDDLAAAAACTAAPNDCSLRGAVIAANAISGSTINIPAGTYQLTTAGAGEQLALTGDLDIRATGTSIVGAGAATTIIQQTVADRVLDINPGVLVVGFTFNMSGVTIKDGNLPTGSGGGMLSGGNGASTVISNCIFDNNKTTGTLAANGGAITDSTAVGVTSLSISDSSFTNNSSATGAGGAVRFNSAGTLTVNRSSFSNNTATTNGGGAIQATGPGAGGNYSITRSSFVNNQGNGSTQRGGAIQVGNGTASISYSRFTGNSAGSGTGNAIAQTGAGSTTANNNWWGQNSGPLTNDLFTTTAVEWLQLRLAASPSGNICPGATSALTADIYGRNLSGPLAGCPGALCELNGLPSFPATFAATNGSVSPTNADFVNGAASSTFTAGGAGAASASVTADFETKTVNFTVTSLTTSDPADVTVCKGAVANFSTTASGTANFAWTLDGSPFNGNSNSIAIDTSTLGVGVHTVSVTASSACGSDTQSATLTVNAPTATTDPADVAVCNGGTANFSTTASGTGPFSYVWKLDGVVYNGNSPSISINTTGMTTGAHSVEVTTTGACGSATQTATLTVGGSPVINLSQTTVSVWPPNHQYQTFTVNDFVASASSTCDPNVDRDDVVILKVTSDELDENPAGADGNTINDMVIAADCKSVQLRAERDSDLNGRVYTITFKVTDAFGNSTTATVTVTVPVNFGGTAVNSGIANTVLSACP